MNNYPISFEDASLREFFAVQPSEVHGVNNLGTDYYKRVLYNKLYSVFEFNIPSTWKINWFRYFLFRLGSIGVIYTKEFGWIAQPYGVEKVDINYNPAQITVSNPNLPEAKTGIIGINAGIIHCFDDFRGFDDIVTRYAVELAQVDKSVDVNLLNCNVAIGAEVSNKKQADEWREAYAKATQGEPFVPINKDLASDSKLNTLMPQTPFLADKLLQARRTIMNEFLTEIGIKNANYDKRERLNADEVNQNNDETRAIISVVYDNIKTDIEAINRISDLNLSVSLRYNYEEEVLVDES